MLMEEEYYHELEPALSDTQLEKLKNRFTLYDAIKHNLNLKKTFEAQSFHSNLPLTCTEDYNITQKLQIQDYESMATLTPLQCAVMANNPRAFLMMVNYNKSSIYSVNTLADKSPRTQRVLLRDISCISILLTKNKFNPADFSKSDAAMATEARDWIIEQTHSSIVNNAQNFWQIFNFINDKHTFTRCFDKLSVNKPIPFNSYLSILRSALNCGDIEILAHVKKRFACEKKSLIRLPLFSSVVLPYNFSMDSLKRLVASLDCSVATKKAVHYLLIDLVEDILQQIEEMKIESSRGFFSLFSNAIGLTSSYNQHQLRGAVQALLMTIREDPQFERSMDYNDCLVNYPILNTAPLNQFLKFHASLYNQFQPKLQETPEPIRRCFYN